MRPKSKNTQGKPLNMQHTFSIQVHCCSLLLTIRKSHLSMYALHHTAHHRIYNREYIEMIYSSHPIRTEMG